MTDLKAEIAALKTEVQYLKFMIPGACALIALLILIFWGIERKNIGKRVTEAFNNHAVSEAIDDIKKANLIAQESSSGIQAIKDEKYLEVERLISEIEVAKGRLPWKYIPVRSVDHSSGKEGLYFNFDIELVDEALGHKEWNERTAVIINTNNQKIGTAKLWRGENGGTSGDAHGRWNYGAAEKQWVTGKGFILVSGYIQ